MPGSSAAQYISSMPCVTCKILSSPTLALDGLTTLAIAIASGGNPMATTVAMPAGNTRFVRIQQ